MRRLRALLCAALLAGLCLLAGCGAKKSAAIMSVTQLREPGRTIGVGIGTGDEAAVREAFPDAEVRFFNDAMLGYTSVANGTLDAFVYGKKQMELALRNGQKGVRLLDDVVGESNRVAVGISPVSPIPGLEQKLNAFLDAAKADGTLDDMYNRWVVRNDDTLPDIELPDNAPLRLRVATTGTVMPYTYYVGTELRGYDIELARHFAAYLGAELAFKIYDYSGSIAAAQSGDADCIMAEVFVTPERSEALPFSHTVFLVEHGVMVRDAGETRARTLAEPNGATVGVVTGTIFPDLVREYLPDAKLAYYENLADHVSALKSGKTDAFVIDEPAARALIAANPGLEIFPESLGKYDFAYLLSKSERGAALNAELSDYLRALKADGTLEALQHKWFDAADPGRVESTDYRGLPAENGTIRLATEQYPPFSLCVEGLHSGYEIELLAMFCRDRGWALEISEMNTDAILPAVHSGKYDIGCSCFTITEERKESVLFSEPHYTGGASLIVLSDEGADAGFLASVGSSFEKTFLRESRWKLFAQGVGTTMLITALSILFGTALGFAVFMLCRNWNPAANAVTRFFTWLINGMPMVVLLMILYYVVFGKAAISGSFVSVVAFTLAFASAVFAMLKSGVGAIDKGQTEAAWALGYSDRRAFFRVVLPQALPHFMPAYKGQITSLVKATAVVGYVAAQDLTKMGDIIRSRTYEAFFPLIAVAVIYFVLAAILTAIVNQIELRIDPRRRKPEDILKGVDVR